MSFAGLLQVCHFVCSRRSHTPTGAFTGSVLTAEMQTDIFGLAVLWVAMINSVIFAIINHTKLIDILNIQVLVKAFSFTHNKAQMKFDGISHGRMSPPSSSFRHSALKATVKLSEMNLFCSVETLYGAAFFLSWHLHAHFRQTAIN